MGSTVQIPSSNGAPATRPGGRVVARERLITQLMESRRRRCIVVQGPVGSGKSALLQAWRESLLVVGFGVAWHGCLADDADPAHFLGRLSASLAKIDPAIGREAALLVELGMDDEAVERVVIALARGIAGHRSDIVLVIDDLHLLTDTRCHEAMQWLLDFAPANLHIALASRAAVPLSLGRLRDQGMALELDMRDLRMSATESEQFLRANLGDIPPREARRLHELTDGWVMGLQLLAMGIRRERSGAAPTRMRTSTPYLVDAQAFSGYFEREVLSNLAPAEVELLTRMSVCPRLCQPLCVALAGPSHPPEDVLALLAPRDGDALFLMPLESGETLEWFGMNPLFRETLQARFNARDEDYRRAVHRAAWIWFRDNDHPDEAVRHALMTGENADAVSLVQANGRAMRVQGNFRKLGSLMRLLPPEEIQAHIELRVWMAMLHLFARELDACATLLDRLEADLPPERHLPRYQVALLRAALHVQWDDPDAVERLLPCLLATPEGADGLVLGARNNLVSWLYMKQGRYEAARSYHAQSPRLLVDGAELFGTSAGLLNGRCLSAMSYALEGRFVQAERIYRDVLFDAAQRGDAASEAACLAATLLGEVLYESSDLVAARRLLEDRVDLLERISIPDSVLRLHSVLAAVHWASGNRQEAFAYLRRLEEYAAAHGLHRLVAHSVRMQAERRIEMGQYAQAYPALERLDALAATARGLHAAEIQCVAQRARIAWLLAHEDTQAARERLDGLIDLCARHGWQRCAVQLRLQAARVDARSGRVDQVRGDVLDVLRQGSRLGLVRSLLDAGEGVLDLIVQVIEDEPHSPVLSFYVGRLQAAQQSARKVDIAAGGPRPPLTVDVLSEREARIVGLLAQALPNKKIARTLDISPETVKWHLKNIYGKLGVSSRDEAVARVRDLNLAGGDGIAPANA